MSSSKRSETESGTQKNPSVRQIKEMVKFMREHGVAEFTFGGVEVKFAFQRMAPTSAEAIESSEKFDEFKKNFDTHLDGRSPSQVEDDYARDLMWST